MLSRAEKLVEWIRMRSKFSQQGCTHVTLTAFSSYYPGRLMFLIWPGFDPQRAIWLAGLRVVSTLSVSDENLAVIQKLLKELLIQKNSYLGLVCWSIPEKGSRNHAYGLIPGTRVAGIQVTETNQRYVYIDSSIDAPRGLTNIITIIKLFKKRMSKIPQAYACGI